MRAIVIGGGPAGLMAAEVLSSAGVAVDLYDAMPSVGRKFLMAGKGGLNLTHAEPLEQFAARYGGDAGRVRALLQGFGPDALRAWCHALGIDTFVGTSGRVFPRDFKAAPLLRGWLQRLRAGGVRFHVRHRWTGWDANGAWRFETPNGELSVACDAAVLALGGGSWPKLGSDGRWVSWLAQRGVTVAPFKPANCGFEVPWSAHFRERYEGAALKSVAARAQGTEAWTRGECVITRHGLEGGLIYALSAALREQIERSGRACLQLDLAPDRRQAQLAERLARPRGRDSLANHLRRHAGITGVKAGLLREVARQLQDPAGLADTIKCLNLTLSATRPLEEAISSAGGVRFAALDERLMLSAVPGCFCAGEMLDWEAPTGGYLLTLCFASGQWAGQGALQWLRERALHDLK